MRSQPEPVHGYPRPQFRRADWTCLNGAWEFALDPEARWRRPEEVHFDRRIQVPFSPETERSGIGETGFFRASWYRRQARIEVPPPGERVILHFGAVDWAATVWVGGRKVCFHEGGYTPFEVDITDALDPSGEQEIVLRAEDDPADLAKPRGKQDWLLLPHSIWYPRTSGIWQTVWTERVPARRIGRLRWTPNLERWELGLEADIEGVGPSVEKLDAGLALEVSLNVRKLPLARDRYAVIHRDVHRRIPLSDPGIDDSRNSLLWSPHSPTLIDADLCLVDGDGRVLDTVTSYTALRSIAVQGDRILLNGRPYPLRLVLDQGYWPGTGVTPPDDEALRKDVKLAKAMGFNGVRKHQKLEDPRYLYWADRLGLLVWVEMPSAYRFTRESVDRLTHEWMAAIARDYSHPCVMAWVPFNESWGAPNLPDNPAERHYVEAIYHLTKTLDPTRLVIGNDGWESVATDIIGIHDYDDDLGGILRRYHAEEVRPKLLRRERPGGRLLMLGAHKHSEHPIVLSEFGGVALTEAGAAEVGGEWGYTRCADAKELQERYKALLDVVHALEMLSGFCYTQFSDTFQEANGLLYADRRPKFPLADIARATRGPRVAREPPNLEGGREEPESRGTNDALTKDALTKDSLPGESLPGEPVPGDPARGEGGDPNKEPR